MDDNITEDEETLFKHVILSWLGFSLKVHMNYMARVHYQIKDEILLIGLLPDLKCNPIAFSIDENATDEVEAKRLLESTLPFIDPVNGFRGGAYAMVLLQSHTHVFRLARAVYEFIDKTDRPWQCRLCLHLFVCAMQAAGMTQPTPISPADLREGPNVAAATWIERYCGESKARLCERWLDPRILTDLPRDLDIFPLTEEERIIQRQPSSGFTYIPLTRQPQCHSSDKSSDDERSA
jgi:hypothetical protein